MKKHLWLLFLLLPTGLFAQLPTCTITATIYNWQGQPQDSVEIWVQKVVNQAGNLIVANPYMYLTDSAGQAQIVVPRSSASDTVTVYLYSNLWGSSWSLYGWSGVPVTVPDASTANLEDLPISNTVPTTYVVAVPALSVYDSTGSQTVTMDTLHIGANLLLVRRPSPSNDYSLALHAQLFAALNDLIAGRGSADSLKGLVDSLVNIRGTLDGHATAIADAGKWNTYTTGGYSVMGPKISDTTFTKITNDGTAYFARTVEAGSTVQTPLLIRDTVSNRFTTDSLLYVVQEHALPLTDLSGRGGVAMGEIAFRMMVVGNDSRVFRIVADSVNGYELQNVHWRTNGGYQYSVDNNSLIGEGEGWIARGNSSSYWIANSLRDPGSRGHKFYVVASIPYSGNSVIVTQYPSIWAYNNRTMITLRVTYFKQTATGYSAQPVKIVEE